MNFLVKSISVISVLIEWLSNVISVMSIPVIVMAMLLVAFSLEKYFKIRNWNE